MRTRRWRGVGRRASQGGRGAATARPDGRVVGAAGCSEAALYLVRGCVLVGKEGGGQAAGEEPAREPQSVGLVPTAAGVGGDEAMDELPDEILSLVVVHWCARRPAGLDFCGCGGKCYQAGFGSIASGASCRLVTEPA
jgi:hypothetical protein